MSEKGGVTMLVAAGFLLVGLILSTVALAGVVLEARIRAQTAADAAALAAAVATFPDAEDGPPRMAAARYAERNGARLVSCRCPVDPTLDERSVRVEAVVRVDLGLFGRWDVAAAAAARFTPTEWLSGR